MSVIQLTIIAININVFALGAIFVFIRKGNVLANRMLGIFFICVAYLTFSMTILEDIVLLAFLIRVFEPFSLLLLPALYLYYVRLIDERKKLRLSEWLHFVLPILSFTVIIPFILKSNEYKLDWLYNSIQDYSFYKKWNLILAAQLFVYVVLFYLKINYFYKNDFIRGDKRKIILQVKYFAIFMLAVFSIGLVLMFLFTPNLYFLALPVQIAILYGIYLLVKSSKLIDIVYTSSIPKSYNSSQYQKIEAYLNNSGDFFQPGISLDLVSKRIGVSTHEISRYINNNKNLNFNDLVNLKRIDEAKKRLHDIEYKHLSFDGVGQSVGFKSKTTFYRAFKKFTGYTPGEYKNLMGVENPIQSH